MFLAVYSTYSTPPKVPVIALIAAAENDKVMSVVPTLANTFAADVFVANVIGITPPEVVGVIVPTAVVVNVPMEDVCVRIGVITPPVNADGAAFSYKLTLEIIEPAGRVIVVVVFVVPIGVKVSV